MNRVFLVSEKTVKELACINDNVASAYILAAIQEAQEIKYQSIVGPALLARLKAIVEAEETDLPENAAYKALLEQSKYYLSYQTVAELGPKVTFKIGNFGVAKSSDENLQALDWDDVAAVQAYWQAKADYYCIELQQFLLDNRTDFPELTAARCRKIRSNLYSAASCGIFLGGARGKR